MNEPYERGKEREAAEEKLTGERKRKKRQRS